MDEKMARTSITVPEGLLNRFRSYCGTQRRSVSAQIAVLMEQALSETEALPDTERDQGEPDDEKSNTSVALVSAA